MDEVQAYRQYSREQMDKVYRQYVRQLLQKAPLWKRPFVLMRHRYRMKMSPSYQIMMVGRHRVAGLQSGLAGTGPPMPEEIRQKTWAVIYRMSRVATLWHDEDEEE